MIWRGSMPSIYSERISFFDLRIIILTVFKVLRADNITHKKVLNKWVRTCHHR